VEIPRLVGTGWTRVGIACETNNGKETIERGAFILWVKACEKGYQGWKVPTFLIMFWFELGPKL